ncbi:helix-turn-helix domain-containing protein [Streptomyces benahoarensis]|uniref:Helix-turn-helix transcriptional regulator n=1 Tax=Streptomyces benahoarensis TaxID=2595054 RepID=A0A553YPW8_9ACTN|nr:helix-turn-helix domain-containing protein [Streptomyces benahoarensis]TSB16465.1 helix-turn-helix transcriptional regulator [Streptomyces benahoarensis]TSB31261.1 helix-turn-helix transcriptional regulator [Streptomyces benahoarensis]
MGEWLVDAEVLARSRFVLSPLIETVATLRTLTAHPGPLTAHPGPRGGHPAPPEAFRARLLADPFVRAWAAAGIGVHWTPDFLSRPPRHDTSTFAGELARVRATPAPEARTDLATACGGRLPRALDVPDPAGRAADLLDRVWQGVVRPDWPRRSRMLEADVIGRVHRLSRHGWAATVADLGPRTRWLGNGRFRINGADRPARDLTGADLVFVPVGGPDGWVAWDLPERYAVIYPASGSALAGGGRPAPAAPQPVPDPLGGCLPGLRGAVTPGTAPRGVVAPPTDTRSAGGAPPYEARHRTPRPDPRRPGRHPLARLLGTNRATLLALLDPPKSTSQLAALTGLGLGSVGGHLKVLLDAALVTRRRAGASVLYHRTPVADALLGAQGTPRTADG